MMYDYTDDELIEEVQSRGYAVYNTTEIQQSMNKLERLQRIMEGMQEKVRYTKRG